MSDAIDRQLTRLRQSSLPFATRLSGRVQDLCESFQDDYGAEPSADALADLITVFGARLPPEYTSLTLTPDGGWYVEWAFGKEGRLAIEFCDGGIARFILHRRNPRHHDKTDVITGSTTSDALVQFIGPLAPWEKQAA